MTFAYSLPMSTCINSRASPREGSHFAEHLSYQRHALQDIEAQVRAYLKGRVLVYADAALPIDPLAAPILSENVQEMRICDTAFHNGLPYGSGFMDWQVLF